MGKKGKKGKKGADENAYRMMTLEEVRAREMKYTQRVEALKHCLNYLDFILMQMEELNEENRILENWLSYLRCDGLPKAYLPPDIRLFFEKLRYFEAESIEKNIDWTLSVDNRSILTQNIFRIDMTRENVKKEKLPNFGEEYNKNIDLALKVLKSIEYYLVDEKMTIKAKPRILDDITSQSKAVQDEIIGFADRYAYRILCSEDSYMDPINARTAEYFYAGTHFEIHIWTIKNVPIIFEFLDEPYMIADLHCMKVQINIPFSILQDNLTIRALHFHFDHYSEHAKSYNQVITIPIESLNAGITDLRDCLVNEWKMQLELQLETRNQMIQKRLEYEEKKRQFDEEEAQRAKDKKNQKDDKKKKSKPIKLPKEPPLLGDNEVPDTWKDFLKNEQKQFEDFLNNIYHPDLLKLEFHEINLKKFIILGGIYQFDFVGKARHFDFNSFNMTWHENDGKILLKNHIRVKPVDSLGRTRSMVSRISENLESRQRKKSSVSDASDYDPTVSSWFIIRMELPEYLCLWGEPVPCHFEEDVIGYIEEEKVEEAPVMHSGKSKKGHVSSAPPTAVQTPAPPTPQSSQIASIFRGSVHSMHTQADRAASIFYLANILADVTAASSFDILQLGIDDFDLNFPLTKSQIRNLERHCLPRIISSYKFPSEFTAEAKEKSAKAKSAGGTLVRRHSAQPEDKPLEGDYEKSDRVFTALLQHDPERLFAVFPTPDELKVRGRTGDEPEEIVPRTFFGLVKKLDSIKKYYIGRVQRTSNLPVFKPNLKLLQPTHKTVAAVLHTSAGTSRRSTKNISAHASVTSVVSRRRESNRKAEEQEKVASMAEVEPQLGAEAVGNAEGEKGQEGDEVNEKSSSAIQSAAVVADTRQTFKFSRWTNKHIRHKEFDRERRMLTIWTDRLGVMGLAYKRYEHFPFRFWCLEPSEENPENEVIFTLETQFVKVVLFVTGEGVRGYVTDLQKKFVRNRPMYLVIEEPLKDFRELRKRFRDKNLNIFTDRDASFYIENGYFCQKHLATELHTYCCMCTHALLMRFLYSDWNRLASRRNLVLRCVHHKESEEYMCTVRIQPEESTFVNIKELCSDDLDVFNLEYSLTWRNIDFYADLNYLIISMYPSAPDQRVKNPLLINFIKALLWEIRPLSFS